MFCGLCLAEVFWRLILRGKMSLGIVGGNGLGEIFWWGVNFSGKKYLGMLSRQGASPDLHAGLQVYM